MCVRGCGAGAANYTTYKLGLQPSFTFSNRGTFFDVCRATGGNRLKSPLKNHRSISLLRNCSRFVNSISRFKLWLYIVAAVCIYIFTGLYVMWCVLETGIDSSDIRFVRHPNSLTEHCCYLIDRQPVGKTCIQTIGYCYSC